MENLLFLKPVNVKNKIRIGRDFDGGYVVYSPALKKTDVLVTYGVGFDFSFEEHFNSMYSKKVLMFDPTMFGTHIFNFPYFSKLVFKFALTQAYKYVLFCLFCIKENRRLKSKNIHYIAEGIDLGLKTESFYVFNDLPGLTDKPLYYQTKAKYDSFKSHIKRYNIGNSSILLKIDIEGGEFNLFNDAGFIDSLKQVTQIIVEFHNLDQKIIDLKEIMKRLEPDYYLIHIHGNNYGREIPLLLIDHRRIMFPETIELTLLRKDSLDPKDILEEEASYPLKGLDLPNNPGRIDYRIRFA